MIRRYICDLIEFIVLYTMDLHSTLDTMENGCISCIQRGFGFTRKYIVPGFLLLKMYGIYKLRELSWILMNVKDYDGIREEFKEHSIESISSNSTQEVPKWFLAMDAMPLSKEELQELEEQEFQEEQQDDSSQDGSVDSSHEDSSQDGSVDSSQDGSVDSSQDASVDSSQEDNVEDTQEDNVEDTQEDDVEDTQEDDVEDTQEDDVEDTQKDNVEDSHKDNVEDTQEERLEYPEMEPITIDEFIPETIREGEMTAKHALCLAGLQASIYKVMVVFMDGTMKTFYGEDRIER
jgi:hypothetical protein